MQDREHVADAACALPVCCMAGAELDGALTFTLHSLISFTMQFSDRYEIHADLPGVPKSSLRVDVDEDTRPHTLTITASRSISGKEDRRDRGQGDDEHGQPEDARVIDVQADEHSDGPVSSPGQGTSPAASAHGKGGHPGEGRGSKGGSKSGKGIDMSKSSKDSAVQAWHRTERMSGTVSRTMSLPQDADITGVGARLDNGVLVVTVPRKKLAEAEDVPGRRRVNIE